jgi:trans-aconitate methyltransferase
MMMVMTADGEGKGENNDYEQNEDYDGDMTTRRIIVLYFLSSVLSWCPMHSQFTQRIMSVVETSSWFASNIPQ